jgi:hypothetical protein
MMREIRVQLSADQRHVQDLEGNADTESCKTQRINISLKGRINFYTKFDMQNRVYISYLTHTA